MKSKFFFTVLFLTAAPFLVGDSVEIRLAEAVLHNGFTRAAEDRFTSILEEENDEEARYAARVGLARVYLRGGKIDEASRVLSGLSSPPSANLGHRASLMRAKIALLQEDAEAADTWLAVTPPLSDEWELLRIQLLARLQVLKGDTPRAMEILKGAGDAPALLVELAGIHHSSGQTAEAVALWEQLAEGDIRHRETQRSLLGLTALAIEDEEWDDASERLKPLIDHGGWHDDLELEGYRLWLTILENEKRYTEAAEHLRAMTKIVDSQETLTALQARRALMLIEAGELEDAGRVIREWIARRGDRPVLAEAKLAYARALTDKEAWEDARLVYSEFLSVFSTPEKVLQAETGLAAIAEAMEEWAEAERLYESAWKSAGETPAAAPLLRKWADVALKQQKYDEAVERYQKLLETFPDYPERGEIALNYSAALAGAGNLPEALDLLRSTQLRSGDAALREKVLLQQAVLLARGLRFEQALGAFDAYLERYPDGEFVVDALTEKGIAAYRLGLFDLALLQFRKVAGDHPEHPRAEQAASLTGWAFYMQGQDDQAVRSAQAFLESYPDSPFRIDVKFWLGELWFNRGNYSRAAAHFIQLTEAPLPEPQRSRAYYLTGRAQLAARNFQEALDAFTRATETGPEAPHAVDTLFYMGDALTELDRFDEAILLFDRLIRTAPDSPLVPAARGRMGDCYYTLGQADPSRYAEALAAYRLVAEDPRSHLELRIQALFKVGITLKALDRPRDAEEALVRMLHLYMDNRERVGPDGVAWFLRGVAETAQTFERRGEIREAIRVYRMLEDSGLPQAAEATRRIENLRREHFILF